MVEVDERTEQIPHIKLPKPFVKISGDWTKPFSVFRGFKDENVESVRELLSTDLNNCRIKRLTNAENMRKQLNELL